MANESMDALKAFDAYLLELQNHDWDYEYADFKKTREAGMANSKKLQDGMRENFEKAQAYWAWVAWAYGEEDLKRNDTRRDGLIASTRNALAMAAVTELIDNESPTETPT